MRGRMKLTGKGPIHSPVFCRKVTNKKPKQKTNKKQAPKTSKTQKHTTHQNKNTTQTKQKRCDRYQFMHERLIGARGDSIVSSHWYGKTNKRQNIKTTRTYPRVSEATKYHAETRDPPRQDPRDHMAQAVKA